jgi:adenylylsulfate kinase-like enzyme
VGERAFLEVHVDAPLAVCEQRDTKGLYAAARRGSVARFTGLTSSYEPPANPDLHLQTDRLSIDDCTVALVDLIRRRFGG